MEKTKDIVVKMFCQWCFRVFDFLVDPRSDLGAFEKYCECPHCHKRQMEIVSTKEQN